MPPSKFTFSGFYPEKQPQVFLTSDLVVFLPALLPPSCALTNFLHVSGGKNITMSKGKTVGLIYLTVVMRHLE